MFCIKCCIVIIWGCWSKGVSECTEGKEKEKGILPCACDDPTYASRLWGRGKTREDYNNNKLYINIYNL